MLMGHTDGLSERHSSKDQLLPDPGSDLDDEDNADSSEQILYTASFEELGRNIIHYDTIIWVSISLLLVLAWGVGIIMLLYLPIRRYVLWKDISSRKLYVTTSEIIYKVSRPSFIPFWGFVNNKKHVPLSRVIDIIIEQGCLQSVYGIHTFRVESIAHGRASPVDELQIQGMSNPGLLRKVIIREATRVMQDGLYQMSSMNEGLAALRSPSKSLKMRGSPHHPSLEHRGVNGEFLLNKIEEVNRSVKKIELLIEKSKVSTESG